MDFVLRAATEADTEGIVACVKEVYDEYGFTWDPADYHADLYDLHGHYRDLGHAFWVAEGSGRVLGTGALERFEPLPGNPGSIVELEGQRRIGGTDCALQRLYVPSQHRGLGIGKALFLRAIAQMLAEGRHAMEIWSDKRFKEAHGLYQSYGAEVVGDRICDDPDVSPEWGLILRSGSAKDSRSRTGRAT